MNRKAARLLDCLDRLDAPKLIVEVGSLRYDGEIASEGFSSAYIAAWCCSHDCRFITIDIEPEHSRITRRALQARNLQADIVIGDALPLLAGLPAWIDCLYLDGPFDPELNMSQLMACLDRLRQLVLIDDTQDEQGQQYGKGTAVIPYLESIGWQVEHWATEPKYRMTSCWRDSR